MDDSRDFLIPSGHIVVARLFPCALSDLRFSFVTIHFGSSENNSQSITHHGSGACVIESMSVLADPATYGKLNSETTNCPRTAAVLGELAAQWQQMMGTLQPVEQEAASSQSLANAIESIGRTRTEASAGRLRLKDGERLYPKSWSGTTPIGGFAREVAAWLGFFDPAHEAGKLMQRTLRATEAWTDGRHAEDDKRVELDYELAVALANATEGAARATVLRITQTEPSHGFVAWQALVDGYAPKSSNDPATALQPTLATPKRFKDAKELKERLTAWSLKVVEY